MLRLSGALAALCLLTACPPLDPVWVTSSSGSTGTSEVTTGEDVGLTGDSTSGLSMLCGNGEVDAGEECDGTEFCFNCVRDRLVFVTGFNARFTGSDVGSVANADEMCDDMARKAGLDGPIGDRHFRAWISDETSSPLTRFAPAPGRYVRPDGAVVATDWGQVLSGLTNAPRMNALGEDEYDLDVWTATLPNGTWEGSGSCGNWTSDTMLAAWGTADKTDISWTVTQSAGDCSVPRALYCVEQAEEALCHLGACWTNADCDFGAECYPAIDGLGTKVCSLPCQTDAACQISCTSGEPEPFSVCSPVNKLCAPVLCEPGDPCDCQPWLNGFNVCFGPMS